MCVARRSVGGVRTELAWRDSARTDGIRRDGTWRDVAKSGDSRRIRAEGPVWKSDVKEGRQ